MTKYRIEGAGDDRIGYRRQEHKPRPIADRVQAITDLIDGALCPDPQTKESE